MGASRLPNLLVVGVPKAGTGSLFAYLGQHPDICAADEKEIGFFNYFNPSREPGREPPPLETYLAHFAHRTDERYAMEATPSYSFQGKTVVDAVQEILDRPKIIIILRDPVDRLWSAYTFQRSLGNIADIHSFADYLDVCQARRADGTDLIPHSGVQGLSIGFYADYLGVWLDAFGADLKVVFAEDMARTPATVLVDILTWLDLDPDVVDGMDLGARNVTKHARSPRVARAVYTVKREIDRRQLIPAALRVRVRRGYLALNSGTAPERLDEATRTRAERLYRDSTAHTARLLAEHGYHDVPAWLRVSAPAG